MFLLKMDVVNSERLKNFPTCFNYGIRLFLFIQIIQDVVQPAPKNQVNNPS